MDPHTSMAPQEDERPQELERAAMEAMLPIGPRQIPVWISCTFLTLVCSAVYGLALAWAFHQEVFGWGPALWRWLSSMLSFLPARWAPFFGSTTFVAIWNLWTVYSFQKRVRALAGVRGAEKRSLVKALWVKDLQGFLFYLLFTGAFLYVLYVYVYGQSSQQFDLVETFKRLYQFLWQFTGEYQTWAPKKWDPNFFGGRYRHPENFWFIRAGAFSIFARYGFLFLKLAWNGVYLLVVRPSRAV